MIRQNGLAALFGAICLLTAPAQGADSMDKIDLWRNAGGPQLRGAAISQRLVEPDVDGAGGGILGPGRLGAPYGKADLDRLASLGANLVVLSHPGLFEEKPPYDRVQRDAQENLDRLVQAARQADLFVVIAFRTGPGRSSFTFHAGSGGSWFSPDKFTDLVWAEDAAQEGWVQMWRHTAARYRGDPAVVGYQLMVEPNSSRVGSDIRKGMLEIYNPAQFHRKYGGTKLDWNQLYPRIVAAIRQVDPDTPILIGGNGYSSIPFLGYVKPTPDKRSVYVVHNYFPWRYTGQEADGKLTYPGSFDADDDGKSDRVDRSLIERELDKVSAFARKWNIPVAVTEFGVVRWAAGAPMYLGDSLEAMEERGMASVLWAWPTSYRPYEIENNSHNYLFGPDPKSTDEVAGNALIDTVKRYWSRNRARPSSVRFTRQEN